MGKAFEFKYEPDGETLKAFMRDDSFVRMLRGHVGSGKSVACAIEVFRRGLAQAPGPDGIRRTRWAVVRNTNPQLKTTTIKTWLEWFPENVFGRFNWGSPYTHNIKVGDAHIEVIFLALDSPADIRKLLSLELTGVWVNEAREVPKAILDGCTQRVGRYPKEADGGPTWSGVICDTNPPEDEHWWPIMAGDTPAPDWMSEEQRRLMVKPEGWSFYEQPPAMLEVKDSEGVVTAYEPNPKRENAKHQRDDYYRKMIPGKAKDWINVYVMNRYGSVMEGRPVYPTFNERVHVADQRLMPFTGHVVYVGIDFGLTPAATLGQFVRGRHFVQREVVGMNMGILRFIPLLKAAMMEHYPGFEFRIFGDPAGDQRVQTDERTPFEFLAANGLSAYPAHTNDPLIRQGAVETGLASMVDGAPGYLVSPCCKMLIKGFNGGYHIKDGGTSADKSQYSHVHDGEQYRMLGTGAGRQIMRGTQAPSRMTIAPSALSGNLARLSGRRQQGRRLF